jgi:hypothetical protein
MSSKSTASSSVDTLKNPPEDKEQCDEVGGELLGAMTIPEIGVEERESLQCREPLWDKSIKCDHEGGCLADCPFFEFPNGQRMDEVFIIDDATGKYRWVDIADTSNSDKNLGSDAAGEASQI